MHERVRLHGAASWLEPWALGAHATLALALETALEVAVDAKVVVVDREHALAVAGALSQRRREGGGMLFVHALVKDKSQCNIEPTPRVCMHVAVASSRTLQLLAKVLERRQKTPAEQAPSRRRRCGGWLHDAPRYSEQERHPEDD